MFGKYILAGKLFFKYIYFFIRGCGEVKNIFRMWARSSKRERASVLAILILYFCAVLLLFYFFLK